METVTNDISTAQRASWNKFSAGWKKWDKLTMEMLRPPGDAIMDHLGAAGTSVVLDIAAGTGEPGLSIARHLHGGKVIITDLAEHMLEVAKEKAAAEGITNVEFREADAHALPFADNAFDEVSCRMGFMFFPDMQQAANEMTRVLKPGGRIATSVWAGPKRISGSPACNRTSKSTSMWRRPNLVHPACSVAHSLALSQAFSAMLA